MACYEEKDDLLWRFHILRRRYPTVSIPSHDTLAAQDVSDLRSQYELIVSAYKVAETRKELTVFLSWIANIYSKIIKDTAQAENIYLELARVSPNVTADDIDMMCRRYLDSLDTCADSYVIIRLTLDAYRNKDLRQGCIDLIKYIGGVHNPEDINECFFRISSFDPNVITKLI